MPALRDVILRYVCHAWTSRYKAWRTDGSACFLNMLYVSGTFDQVLKNLLAVPWQGDLNHLNQS